jgi:hypothetical protein
MHERACFAHSFNCAFFNGAFISPDSISSDGKMIIELQWIWKEMVVSGFEVMSLHLAQGSEENHEKP